MLREQRDEIFCFLYEATRFSKENHKKYENSVNKLNHDMKKVKDKKVSNLFGGGYDKEQWDNVDKVFNDYDKVDKYKKRDSVSVGKEASKYPKDSVRQNLKKRKGQKVAKQQPGRYEKPEERKPNKYKEMYDKKKRVG